MAKKTARKIDSQIKKLLNPTFQSIMAVGLFAIATVAAQATQIPQWESQLFYTIHEWPRVLYPLFYVITQAGSIFMLAGLLALYLFRGHYHIVLRLLMTGTLAYLLAGIAKSLWGRGRPFEVLDQVTILDVIQGPGFPSGHAALATALALTMGHYLIKKYHWIPVAWIVGVGLSRVYLGAHLPLDIIGGFALGWLSYALFRHVRIYDISTRKKSNKKLGVKLKRL
jgi:membrane-associated phospholipid phosphatase